MIPHEPRHGGRPGDGEHLRRQPDDDRIEVWDRGYPGHGRGRHHAGAVRERHAAGSVPRPGRRRDQPGCPVRLGRGPVRVQAFDITGTRRPATFATVPGQVGSTFGDGAYDFRGAIGLDADAAGRSLRHGHRATTGSRSSTRTRRRLQDAVGPSVPTITAPANQSVAPLGPVTDHRHGGRRCVGRQRGSVHPGHDHRSVVGSGDSSFATAIPRPILAAYWAGPSGRH